MNELGGLDVEVVDVTPSDNSWVAQSNRCEHCNRNCAPTFLIHGICGYCRNDY